MTNRGSVVIMPLGHFQRPFIQYVKRQGYDIIGIDESSNAACKDLVDHFLCFKLTQEDKILRTLKSRFKSILGVTSYCSDVGIALSAHVAHAYQLVGPSLNQVDFLTRKDTQRQLWEATNLPNPKFVVCDSAEELVEILGVFKGKTVIKPVDSSGSRGIRIIENPKQFQEKDAQKVFEASKIGRVIAEQFISGDEYTIDAFFEKGICRPLLITKKFHEIPNLPTVASGLKSIDITSKIATKITQCIEEAFSVVVEYSGPAHCEVKLNDEEIAGIVEISGRGGGSNLANKMIEFHSGQDYFQLILDHMLSKNQQMRIHLNLPTEMIFIPYKLGRFQSISFPSAPSNVKCEYDLYVRDGTLMTNPMSDGDRIGDFVLSSQDKEELDRHSRRLNTELKVVTDVL